MGRKLGSKNKPKQTAQQQTEGKEPQVSENESTKVEQVYNGVNQ